MDFEALNVGGKKAKEDKDIDRYIKEMPDFEANGMSKEQLIRHIYVKGFYAGVRWQWDRNIKMALEKAMVDEIREERDNKNDDSSGANKDDYSELLFPYI